MKTGTYYGIDFGTTNTSVYLYNYTEFGVSEERYGTDGKDIYPFSSCIALPNEPDGEIYFGRYVRENSNALAETHHIINSFKSLLGTKNYITIGETVFTGKRLAALFLDHVKKTVNRKDLTEAVFSIPVDFTAEARKELREAAEKVGISVKGFVSESSAAYISKMESIKAYSKVLVIDWGGGTLDLSILDLMQNKIYEDAVYGVKFGGDNIDDELAHRIHPMVYPDKAFDELEPSRKDRLMRNVEQMKIEFSTNDDDYEMRCGPGSKLARIEYDTFDEIIAPLVMKNVIAAIGKIMNMADVKSDGIDAVILAGGSSGIRPFAEAIKNIFGEDKIIFDKQYQWIVARGAAIASAIDCDFRLNDDICVKLSDGKLFPILKKDINKVGDHSEKYTFSITDDSSDAHFIFCDSSQKNSTIISVRTKGYFDETLTLSGCIEKDQIAKIEISNPSISSDYTVTCELNKLKFYYDMTDFGR